MSRIRFEPFDRGVGVIGDTPWAEGKRARLCGQVVLRSSGPDDLDTANSLFGVFSGRAWSKSGAVIELGAGALDAVAERARRRTRRYSDGFVVRRYCDLRNIAPGRLKIEEVIRRDLTRGRPSPGKRRRRNAASWFGVADEMELKILPDSG